MEQGEDIHFFHFWIFWIFLHLARAPALNGVDTDFHSLVVFYLKIFDRLIGQYLITNQILPNVSCLDLKYLWCWTALAGLYILEHCFERAFNVSGFGLALTSSSFWLVHSTCPIGIRLERSTSSISFLSQNSTIALLLLAVLVDASLKI